MLLRADPIACELTKMLRQMCAVGVAAVVIVGLVSALTSLPIGPVQGFQALAAAINGQDTRMHSYWVNSGTQPLAAGFAPPCGGNVITADLATTGEGLSKHSWFMSASADTLAPVLPEMELNV